MTEFDMVSSSVAFNDNRLCYSGQRCHRIPDALAKLYGPRVHSLDLSYNELVSVRGLEGFPLLRELVLDNNQLTDECMVFPHLPHLHTLSLNKNHINDIEFLVTKISKNFPCLTYLSLLGNKACPNQLSGLDNDDEDYQRYRYYVLHHLPNLQFLDSSRVALWERDEARRRGQLMKVVRPKMTAVTDGYGADNNTRSEGDDDEDSDAGGISRRLLPAALRTHQHGRQRGAEGAQNECGGYTPLPRGNRRPDDHRGAYTRCKYKYSGKNSEGNRFISNNDL